LAEDTVVDEVASNYLITRLPGTNSTGDITVVVSELRSVTFSAGSIFEADGQEYSISAAVTAVTSAAEVQSPTDKILNPVGDGTYTFSFAITALVAGEAGDIRKGTLIVPQDQPLNYVTSYAENDFSGGQSTETNTELITRLLTGVAAKTLSGRVHMSAALREQPGYENLTADSIIGFGDGEMLRDQHSIFPGSLGGRVDWYTRVQERVNNQGLTKTATLVEKTDDGFGIWQFSLTRDDAPGFYDVREIILSGATSTGSYTVTADIRSTDMTTLDNDGFLPDIDDSFFEGVYSRFQTAIIQFKDTDTPTAALVEFSSTQNYAVTARVMPSIADIQDWAAARDVRNYGGDVLIKAPVPCFIELSFTIELQAGQTTPDLDAIKTALAQGVNQYGFTGHLPASFLSDIVHNSLVSSAYVSAINILGRIRRPNGTIRQLQTTETLVVPDEPTNMVSGKTVAFLLDTQDIAISVDTADIPQI
jgi:hypothetical protein